MEIFGLAVGMAINVMLRDTILMIVTGTAVTVDCFQDPFLFFWLLAFEVMSTEVTF